VIIASPTLGGLAMQRIRGTQTAASDGDLKVGESGSRKAGAFFFASLGIGISRR
jgi:hypothetical protein